MEENTPYFDNEIINVNELSGLLSDKIKKVI